MKHHHAETVMKAGAAILKADPETGPRLVLDLVAVVLDLETQIEAARAQATAQTDAPAAPICGARAVPCVLHPGAAYRCPDEGHEHDPCTHPAGHLTHGPHSWAEKYGATVGVTWPAERAAATFSIPAPPPVGSKVTADDGEVWTIALDRFGGQCARDSIGMFRAWGHFLAINGPATLLQLSDQEEEQTRLYGPIGARWGNPDQPCGFGNPDQHWERPLIDGGACTLGQGHIGPHIGGTGLPIEAPDRAQEPTTTSSVPCTCGNHAHHTPSCPRYSGPSNPGHFIAQLAAIVPGVTGPPVQCGDPNMAEDADEYCTLPAGHTGPHDPYAGLAADAPYASPVEVTDLTSGDLRPMIQSGPSYGPGFNDDDEGPGGDRE